MQGYESGSPGLYQQQPNQSRSLQDFQVRQQQQQEDDVTAPPFSDSTMNGVGAYQTETQTSSPSLVVGSATSTNDAAVAAPIPNSAVTTPVAHYTLSMHDALLYFQQSLARFHDEQLLVAQDAAEFHARQLEEFQREKEERKTRLKRTKLVRELHVVPMGSSTAGASGLPMNYGTSTAGRARGLWAIACKARMFEM